MGFVRVKGPDGSEFTIDERVVEGMGVTVLDDKPAVDASGFALPWKPATNKAGQPKAAASDKPKEG